MGPQLVSISISDKEEGSQTDVAPLAIIKRFLAKGLSAVNTFSVNAFPFDQKSLSLPLFCCVESICFIFSCNVDIGSPSKLSNVGTSRDFPFACRDRKASSNFLTDF